MKNMNLSNLLLLIGAVILIPTYLSSCGNNPNPKSVQTEISPSITLLKDLQQQPTLFARIEKGATVIDGMAKNSKGELFLSTPNFLSYDKDKSYIISFDSLNQPYIWFDKLPLHSETGKVHPFGIEFGPDGNLYICDNQYFNNTDNKSRILRIIVENDKPVKCEVVVEGLRLANAIRFKGNDFYVSDTYLNIEQRNSSAIYKFNLTEIASLPLTIKPQGKDAHLLCTIIAKDLDSLNETAGADGICFDSKGNLFCGNFGDGVIRKISLKEDGSYDSQTVLIDLPILQCCDGITADSKDRIYITDSKNNAIYRFDSVNNTLQKIWDNEDNNGSTGLLDQPCEPIIKDNTLIVVNFDMPFPGLRNSVNDEFITLSAFDISEDK